MELPSPPRLRDVAFPDDMSEGDWSFLSGTAPDYGVDSLPDDGLSDWYDRMRYCESRWEIPEPVVEHRCDCGEAPQDKPNYPSWMPNAPMSYFSHDCGDNSGVKWDDRHMNTNYDLNGRDRRHTYKDFRSPRKARKRQRVEREKYYKYRFVKRGQLGVEHLKLDYDFPKMELPADAEKVIVSKKDLYEMAQAYPRPPKYHQSHAWDRRCNEPRLQRMHDIKRFDLDEFHYYDYDPRWEVHRTWCCSFCCIGTGIWQLEYGVDGNKRWEGDGTSAHYLGTLENVPVEWASEEDINEAYSLEREWIENLSAWIVGMTDEYPEDDLEQDWAEAVEAAVFEYDDLGFPPLPSVDGEPRKVVGEAVMLEYDDRDFHLLQPLGERPLMRVGEAMLRETSYHQGSIETPQEEDFVVVDVTYEEDEIYMTEDELDGVLVDAEVNAVASTGTVSRWNPFKKRR